MNRQELEKQIGYYLSSPNGLCMSYRVIVCEVDLDGILSYLESKNITDVTIAEIESVVMEKLEDFKKKFGHGQ